jgi:N-acylglucosamine 2-epimerase
MDSTKSVWFQGRFGWMTAYAYNHMEKNPEWLAASKSCCEFLEAHCFDKDGRAYFEVTAEGVGLQKRRYVFSECFAAIAYAEYSLASGDKAWAKKAVALFKRIRKFVANPKKWMPSKFEPVVQCQGHSLTMILINVAMVLKQISDDPVLDQQITESIDLLTKYFIHPEFKALLETVGPNGEFIDTLAGRVINPGHCIETSWFLMDVAVARKDKALLKTALKILDWSWDWGWDKKYGGIISFKDCRNLPPQCYEQDMKFWWPQCETIIASAYAYKLTGDAKYMKWHKLASEWAWKHLKDRKYPEWYGYLHRDGTVAQPAKGNIFKGPFHIPRMLVKAWEIVRS